MSQGVFDIDTSTSESTIDSGAAVNIGTGTARSVNLAASGVPTNVKGPVSLNSYSESAGIATPGTNPATGAARLYYRDTNDGFYYLDHAGAEHAVANGGTGMTVLYTATADCLVSGPTSYTSLISGTATAGSSLAYTPVQGDTIVIDAGGTFVATNAATFTFRLIKNPSSAVTLAALQIVDSGGVANYWSVHIEFTFRTASTGRAMGNNVYSLTGQYVYYPADIGAVSGISTASNNMDFQVLPSLATNSITCTNFIMTKKPGP